MRLRYAIILVLMVMAGGTLAAQLIVDQRERKRLMEDLDQTINNSTLREQPQSLHSPFMARPVDGTEPLVEDAETGEPVAAPPPAPRVLPDAVALQAIARQFRPLGSLVRGDRGVLQLRGGGSIAKGESFRASIEGVNYSVFIEDVSESGYVLRLGEALLQRDFFTNQP